MPTVSVFFRKDDLDKWKAIENKSEWLHQQLAPTEIRDTTLASLNKAEKIIEKATPDEYGFNNIVLDEEPLPEVPPEYEEPDFSAYVVDPITHLVYERETGERVPAKVKDDKITEIL